MADAAEALMTEETDETRTYKVLLIEDDEALAEMIMATLERLPVEGYHERRGGPSLDVYREVRPDLVLLDIGLPDMLGWHFLDKLKGEEGKYETPVVVITCRDDPANRLMGKLQGVSAYLIKPFSPETVAEVVMRMLQGEAGSAEPPALNPDGGPSAR